MDEFIPGFDDPDDELSGYFDDNGNKLNPELIHKPALCLLCATDENPHEKVMCTLHRFDSIENTGEFSCSAYQPKTVS